MITINEEITGDAVLVFFQSIGSIFEGKKEDGPAVVISEDKKRKITLKIDALTSAEKDIILKGCLINYYRG